MARPSSGKLCSGSAGEKEDTDYAFRFEAFDEPWKHQFDEGKRLWEPFWGVFDKDRVFKPGLKIPDCGGRTVEKPY
jgi:hypothetical protein